MTSVGGQETEAKFYVRNLKNIKTHLEELDARLIQPRVLEQNIRFDRPDASLLAEGRVLRLRQDTQARLTYKSASTNDRGVLSRTEIEFTVEEFEKARQFLEALGYRKLIYYEKYRMTYQLEDNLVMLDELPYGNFVEIEGKGINSIRAAADQLGLLWETAIAASYHALFERGQVALNFSFQDITFENFAELRVTPLQLGVRAADS